MKRLVFPSILASLALSVFCALVVAADRPSDKVSNTARKIRAQGGVRGGLVVHLGCSDGHLTAALAAGSPCLVQGLDVDAACIEKAREYIRSMGPYGRVSVELFDGRRLPYADNLVNLLVAEELGRVAMDEVVRVLAPGGVACVNRAGHWEKTVKPRPDDIDDWTHYLHDASGNAVAADRQVGPPKQVRWIASPVWSRSHEYNPSLNAAVSGGGRLFYTLDEGVPGIPDSPKFRFPERWSLIARDAFSGVQLWKRPIPNWGYREWNTVGMWSAPLTLARRLVTDGQRVFFTFGYKAPVTVLDAATGKTLRTIPDSEGTDEMILADGVLLLCVREQLSVAAPPKEDKTSAARPAANPKGKTKARPNNPHEWAIGPPGPAAIVAVDVQSGKVLWRRPPQPVMILTLAASAVRICFHDDQESIVCLDRQTGERKWTAPCASTRSSRQSGGTLVMHDKVVLFTGAKGLTAFSAADGHQLWNGPTVQGPGVSHPPDLFVADGLVWGGDVVGTHSVDRTAVHREGRDPRTGQVGRTIEVVDLISPLHHFRCYRSKATDRFLLLTKRGVEFLDIHGDEHMREDWLRAGCSYGFLPCNGLLYVTPHHCFCYPGVKMNGFLALASSEATNGVAKADDASRLEQGPAYNQISTAPSSQPLPPSTLRPPLSEDWPTYRHDPARSGHLASDLRTHLVTSWQTAFGGRLSQPVVVGRRMFIAQVDSHAIHALDAIDGQKLWSYTAGARVDSPPTIHAGLVLFGCRDGWVYCLRAADGALAWRFRAAPDARQIVAFDQLESSWPVAGSVLVQNGVAYVAAGRSSFLDGGVYLYGLDPATGRVLCKNRVDGPWPNPAKDVGQPFDMEGTKSDILVGDGKNLYLYQMMFDADLCVQEAPRMSNLGDRQVGLHLMSTGGLVDYEWYDRTYWTYSRRWPGFYYADKAPKAGQILVFDDQTVFGLHVFTKRLRLSPVFTPGGDGCELFADDVANEPLLAPTSINREKGPGFSRAAEPKWSHAIPLRARGMVLAGKTLFLAGPPDVVPDDDPYASFGGRLGAKLWAVSATNGTKLAEYDLKSEPVFDGLVAAAGRLYLSTAVGEVMCFEGK